MASAPAAPFDKNVSLLRPDSTKSSNRVLRSRYEAPHWSHSVMLQFHERSTLAIVPSYDSGGQTGIEIAGGNKYTGIYANNTAYQPAQLALQPASDPNNPFNVLYAPTMKGSDGSCLENGTDYWRYLGDGVTATFRIYDFCTGGGEFVLSKNIDAAFSAAYLRYFPGAATPQYTTEIKLLPDGKWHSLIYNYTLNAYEDLYSVAGSNNYNGGMGWSIFETHYAAGPCSTPPDIVSSLIQVQSGTGSWSPITPANSDSAYNWGPCFSNGQGDPYSAKAVSNNGSMWDVSSVTVPTAPPLSPYAQTIVNDGPVAYYRLGDGTVSATDISGIAPALTGTYGSNVTRLVPSLLAVEASNGAAQFRGNTSVPANFISVPPAQRLQPAQNLSIETWLKTGGKNSGTVDLVSYGPESSGQAYTLQLLANGTIGAYITTSGGHGVVTGTTILAQTRSYLVDATYDGSTLSIYVDGALDASAPVTGTLNYSKVNNSNGLSIGSAFSSSRQALVGTLDEVAIFGTTLTSAQIAAHWTAGSGAPVAPTPSLYTAAVSADSPAAFYRLSDPTSTAVDASPNGLNATYGTAVKRDVAGLLNADVRNNGALFPGGPSSTSNVVSRSRNAKLEPPQTVSLETWIEISAAPSQTIDLVSYGPEALGQPYTLQLGANQTVQMFATTTHSYAYVQGHTAISLNTPHLIDATYDGTTMNIYVDGNLDATRAQTGALNYSKVTTTYGLSIGTAFDTTRSTLAGELDDVAVYPAALTPQRISVHWTAGSGNRPNP